MNLRDWMYINNLKVNALAHLLDCHCVYIGSIVSGKNLPSIQLARKIIRITKGEVGLYDLYPDIYELQKGLRKTRTTIRKLERFKTVAEKSLEE